MHKLNDPVLLAQCARIKTMIEEVARTPARQGDYYAASYHHWKLRSPVTLQRIEKFEKKTDIELPTEYVYYLTQVSRGGASPGTYFSDFPDEQGYNPSTIAGVSEKLSKVMSEEDWNALYGKEGHAYIKEPGVIWLCAMDLTYVAFLIVTGPNRGRVVYLDYDCDLAPMWPKGNPDFLSWCENFFSELLAGYRIYPTWNFMWQEPGDESALICAFRATEDKHYQEDILASFCKFQKLSEDTYQFLENIQDSELQDIAKKVLWKFPRY